jgi:hypothetical protein
MNLWEMTNAGFNWEQSQDIDISGIQSSFDAYITSLDTWFTSAVSASSDGLPIPAPPAIPTLPNSTLPGIILSILVKIIIKIATEWLQKILDPDTESKEIAQVLKRAFLRDSSLGDEYSLLELLANHPLTIQISSNMEYQDFEYNVELPPSP